jgi:hypothetical protein
LDLRVTKRFDCNRIRFRLKRLNKISLSTRTTINVIKKDQERQILIKNIFNSHENPDSEFYLMVYEEKIVTEIADTLDNIALDINKNHILNS